MYYIIILYLKFHYFYFFNGDGCEFLLIYNFWDFLEVDMFFLN